MLEYIFNELQHRLLCVAPEIKGVYIYNNQDAFSEEFNPTAYPAAYIQYGDIEYTTTSRQNQTAKFSITVKLFHESLTINHLEVFRLSEKINQYLNGWGTWGYALDEIGESTDTNFDRLYIYNLTYDTAFNRCTTPLSEFVPIGDWSKTPYSATTQGVIDWGVQLTQVMNETTGGTYVFSGV